PDAYQRSGSYPAPDAEAAVPYREHPPPGVRRDLARRGDVEVDAAADDAGRNRPDRHVGNERRVAPVAAHPALRDQYGKRDADDGHEPVEVDEKGSEVETVDRRARDVAQRHAGCHATERRPDTRLLCAGPPGSGDAGDGRWARVGT